MDIAERARATGVQTEYVDAWGNQRHADIAVLEDVVAAVGAGALRKSAREGQPPIAFQGISERTWLLTCQLYGLRSDRNWGIGDFSDLRALIKVVSKWGCAGIGVNPLHALFDDRPRDHSPYAPNSRLFLNTIYIDWTAVDDFDPEWERVNADRLDHARNSVLVDYSSVAPLKLEAAHAAFENFLRSGSQDRATSFEAFQRQKGRQLIQFACFEVLRKHFSGPWWDWPQEWRTPSDEAARELAQGEWAREVAFVQYVQWVADEQLTRCTEQATTAGMEIGLYLDVAVGIQAGGFDAWYEQQAIMRSLSVGAPPDVLNTAGQDWGLSGFSGAGLQHRGYEPFREMLKSAMHYAGAIRLDHVLGMRRLFVIPHGRSPQEGVYIDMPFEEMADVVAEESRLHDCVVIGEDLGTVPEGLREHLGERGILSYTVMMFERHHAGYVSPEEYRRNSLVTFNTHDLATFSGWQTGADLTLKRAMSIDPGETDEQRRQAVSDLGRCVSPQGSTELDFVDVVRALARSPCRILAVAVEDLLGVIDQPNVPGTVNEHPNWRRRLPVTIDNLESSVDVASLREVLAPR